MNHLTERWKLSVQHWTFAFLLLSLLTPPSPAATLRTLDNQSLDSPKIQLASPNLLVLTDKDNQPLRIPLDQILSAQFQTNPSKATTPGQARPRWVARDIGQVAASGSARFADDTLTVKGAGAENWIGADAGHFVYQALPGDGQIVARIAAISEASRFSRAGLMIRSNLEPHAASVAVVFHARERAGFYARSRLATAANQRFDDIRPPGWLKLVRRGNTISAFTSSNGADWADFGSATLILPPAALAGLVVSSNNPTALASATFENVSLTQGLEPSESSAKGNPKGILLRNGSFLAGRILSANDSIIAFASETNPNLSIPTAQVAQLHLSSTARDAIATSKSATPPGLLLRSGDFFAADIQSLDAQRIRVNSILFGPRAFDTSQVLAALLRNPTSTATRYQVRTTDGSLLLADNLSIQRDQLVLDNQPPLRFPAEAIVEIKAGPARFQPLTDLKPSSLNLPPSAIIEQASLVLPPASTLTYTLDGQFKMLLLRLLPDEGHLPTAFTRLTIIIDGKEVYQSPSTSNSQDLVLSLASAKTLTLRTDAGPAAPLAAPVILSNPSLLK